MAAEAVLEVKGEPACPAIPPQVKKGASYGKLKGKVEEVKI